MSVGELDFSKVHGNFTSAFVKVVNVTKVGIGKTGFGALVYQCKLNVDWDGAPSAYGKDNPRDALPLEGFNKKERPAFLWNSKLQAFERVKEEDHFQRNLMPLETRSLSGDLKDATFTFIKGKNQGLYFDHNFRWVGVAAAKPEDAKKQGLWIDDREVLRDHDGKFPVIQKDGPTKGYYVSTSGTPAISKEEQTPGWEYRQSSYWDASTVPYCVWPSLLGHGVRRGDFGLVISHGTGRSSGFFFGDTGSTTKLGECSGALVAEVAGSRLDNPRIIEQAGLATFIVFPGSSGGILNKGQQDRTERTVKSRIALLSGVDSAEELIDFLSLGADLDRWERNLREKHGYDSKSIPEAVYYNLLSALKKWGFQTAHKAITV